MAMQVDKKKTAVKEQKKPINFAYPSNIYAYFCAYVTWTLITS
jgi:hypothetical protein